MQTLCAFTIQLVDTFIRDEEEEREESPLSFEREKNNSASEPFSSSREGKKRGAGSRFASDFRRAYRGKRVFYYKDRVSLCGAGTDLEKLYNLLADLFYFSLL